ncbi:glutamate--tRNA ligase [Synechococcus sp. BA-124 BA4]|uniref:glutamate--tRNA ligase n=1 Tax=unclassified Synechococcus TaxID=2626047 RepID=UPI0018CD101A|nr:MULTISPECIES: glutamate--tRNA ligase [unclassified Synechococcus]MEA5399311.1 glutamate--tRNA ligase [Synechococcus sp. BA-124 BA4]QPN56066.1 glutamate--tRNA ligase [Synechococcus sp. CBW1107]CAK6699543.1 Glutamate--tRNA ligase [Synechococcus sp. CBW1107]
MTVRVRLAPSPTGTLHIGTARTAVFNWLFARHHGGQFLLRIEDTDRERSRPEFTADILDGLSWLGLSWDAEPVIQSERIEAHRNAIGQLLEAGLAYRCYASEAELEQMREQQKASGSAPRYDNRHRHLTPAQEQAYLAEGREAVVRFRIDDGATIAWSDLVRGEMRWSGSDLGGDMVIARRAPADRIGDPLYNLVVVVDDAAMAISHVIRGEDHIANTAKQLLLYEALGLPLPVFAHTPLILNQEGRKLSKRDGVTSVGEFRAMGYTAEALVNYMTLLGWSPPEGLGERFTLTQAATAFDFDRVNRAGARFDWDKLNWLNAQVLHELNPAELSQALVPLWQAEGWRAPDAGRDTWEQELAELLGPSLTTLRDGVEQARPFFERPEPDAGARQQLETDGAIAALRAVLERLEATDSPDLSLEQARSLLTEAASTAGVKKGVLMKSLRAGLLGSLQGPDLISTWRLLHASGEDRKRLMLAVAQG